MKKLFVAAAIVALFAISSCSSGAGSSFLGGTWSYNGISYNAISAVGSTTLGTLTATTASTTEADNVIFHFSSFPPAAGSYTIVNTLPLANTSQVYVITNIGTKGYTIDNAATGTATVSVSGSKISVSVPAVTFSNITGQAASSGSFTAAINQNL